MLSNFDTFSHRNWSKCVTSSKTVLSQWYLGVGRPQQFSLCAAPAHRRRRLPTASADCLAQPARRHLPPRLPGKLLFSRETDFVPLCFFGNLKSASTAYFQNTKHLCQYIHDTVYLSFFMEFIFFQIFDFGQPLFCLNLAHWIKQPIPRLRILNFPDFFLKDQ